VEEKGSKTVFKALSFPRKWESRDVIKTDISGISHPVVMPAHAGISVLRASVRIHHNSDSCSPLRGDKIRRNDKKRWSAEDLYFSGMKG
jgi:hypothetical protein